MDLIHRMYQKRNPDGTSPDYERGYVEGVLDIIETVDLFSQQASIDE